MTADLTPPIRRRGRTGGRSRVVAARRPRRWRRRRGGHDVSPNADRVMAEDARGEDPEDHSGDGDPVLDLDVPDRLVLDPGREQVVDLDAPRVQRPPEELEAVPLGQDR